MSLVHKKICLSVLIAAALTLTACFFSGPLRIEVFEGIVSISVGDPELEGSVNLGACFENPEEGVFDCNVNGITSGWEVLTLPELVLALVVLDPLVIQVPAGLTNFSGSYQHFNSGTSGPLAITSGLASVPIDVDRLLVAEPGTQLVVVGFPAGSPTTGRFTFRLNFEVPPGTTEVEVKPIITGLVELTDGSVFYPPVLPCVDSMAEAPAVTIPVSAPGGFTFLPPLTPDLGCSNVTYNFIPTVTPLRSVYLPFVGRSHAGGS